MSQNFASAWKGDVDEAFSLKAVTSDVVNKDMTFDMTGIKTVTIYTMPNVDEVDYTRNGFERFGHAAELDTGTEEFTMTQDKAYTAIIDRGNLSDSMMVQKAEEFHARQVRQVVIPNTDKYRLATFQAYAIANSQNNGGAVALSSSNFFTKFQLATETLINNLVDIDRVVAYLPPATYSLAQLDSNFIKASNLSQEMLKSGVVGMVNGIKIKRIPVSYLPANTGFLMVYDGAMAAPQKFKMQRTLTEQRGVDGYVPEARRYHDAWILANKGVGIIAHMNA